MFLWIAIIAAGLVIGVLAFWATRPEARRARNKRRRRYRLEETGQRVPLAPPDGPSEGGTPIFETPFVGERRRAPTMLEALRQADAQPPPPAPLPTPSGPAPVLGRFVQTPDGEQVITTPPFVLRPAFLGRRTGRYVNRLSLRVPAWVMCCPKVRLDSLLTPTSPEGREAADFAAWRRRVRWRSIDIVLADRRTWRPMLAIVFRQPARTPVARNIGGNQDRMIDEVLGTVGLPLVRVSGAFEQDWPLIRPYIEQAILPSPSDEPGADVQATSEPIAPEAAVNLLRLDQDKGWLLG